MAAENQPPDDAATPPIVYSQEEDSSPLSDTLHALPSHVARGLLYLIVAFLLIAFTLFFFNKIDIVTSVPAIIAPEGKTRLIQPALPGIVEHIYVREGERVTRGQKLVLLDAAEVGQALAALRETETELALARRQTFDIVPQKITHLQKNIQDEQEKFALRQIIHRISLEKLQESLRRQQLDRTDAQANLTFIKKEVEVNQRLHSLGLIAELKLLEVQRKEEEAAGRIAQIASMLRDAAKEGDLAEKNFAVIRKQRDTMQRQIQEQIDQLQRDAEERYTVARARHEQAQALAQLNLRGVSAAVLEQAARGEGQATNRTLITAPEDGIISQLLTHHTGEAVERGQTLMSLIPQHAELVAELRIANKDIGAVRLGQPVKLKFDAFPYAEYGAITGQVIRIAPEAQADATSPSFYQALASLGQTYFRVEGDKVPLLPGMTAAAEIITDQQTIFDLILKPFADFTQAKEADK